MNRSAAVPDSVESELLPQSRDHQMHRQPEHPLSRALHMIFGAIVGAMYGPVLHPADVAVAPAKRTPA